VTKRLALATTHDALSGDYSSMFLMPSPNLALLPQLVCPTLQVLDEVGSVLRLVTAWNYPRGITEQIIHLFQRQFLRFWQEKPEEHTGLLVSYQARERSQTIGNSRITEVTHYEDDVVSPSDVGDSDASHLSNHGVEREGYHCCDRDALGDERRK
jgi:hypothetical protein